MSTLIICFIVNVSIIDFAYFIYGLVNIITITDYRLSYFELWIINLLSILLSFKNYIFGIMCILQKFSSNFNRYWYLENILENIAMLIWLKMVTLSPDTPVHKLMNYTEDYFIFRLVWSSIVMCSNLFLIVDKPLITTPMDSSYGSTENTVK